MRRRGRPHQVSELIQRLDGAALVSDSLGGFYAVQLAARHGIPAALINPAMRPWALFRPVRRQRYLML